MVTNYNITKNIQEVKYYATTLGIVGRGKRNY